MKKLTTTFHSLLRVSKLLKCCQYLGKLKHNTPNFYKTNFELKAGQIVSNRLFE